MGRGIAAVCLQAGFRVRFSDIDSTAAAAAVRELQTGDLSAFTTPQEAAAVITTDDGFTEPDLVIETVAEDLGVKHDVLSRTEQLIRPDAVLASNSSSIPMTQLAECLENPQRFCGLHFCYPVEQRPLVEIIGAENTSAATLKRVDSVARTMGMAPVTVRDAPGFLLNRVLLPCLNEALELVLEQVDLTELDATARQFGFPAGPLAQLDDFGLDVALSVGKTLFRSFPDRIGPSEMLIAMYKAKRLGRKTGQGFYFEGGARSDTVVPAVQEIIERRTRNVPPVRRDDIERRLFLPMLLEATRALQDSLVDSTHVVDQVLRDGLGMTDRYRGLFGWADAVGIDRILEWLKPLESLGKRFEPTPLLLDMAAHRDTRLSDWKSAA